LTQFSATMSSFMGIASVA